MKSILGAYIVVQLLILSCLMMLQFQIIRHVMMMTISCVAYFVVAFKNPGYYQADEQTAPHTFDFQKNLKKYPSIQDQIIKEQIEEEDAQSSIDDKVQQISKKIQQKIVKQNQLNKKQNQGLDFCKDSQQLNESHPKIVQKLQKVPEHNFKIETKEKSTVRYCRICKVIQPYRVRHCHECEKCICTFDHHCPWMDNCIGQKNRNTFWFYLLVQFSQFLMILVDISGQVLMTNEQQLRLYFFAGLILLLTAIIFCMLIFHTYLMLKNLTTWEFVKWEKINYLSSYQSKHLSPFSFGLLVDLQDYFIPKNEPKSWVINPQFLKRFKENEKQEKPKDKIIEQKPQLKNNQKRKSKTQKIIVSHNVQ